MDKFKITGEMKVGEEYRKFTKEVEANTENHARETVFALIGAQNGIKRTNVRISEVSKV
ncbi:MAG: 50S ribosomal protein L18Ae [Candidatus Micrarchaeia archaeon]